jgi:uncharacterized delta-60 repeat protein
MCSLPTHLRSALVAALAVAALTLTAPAQANPGDLDSPFGSGGIVLSDLDTVEGSSMEDVVVQPDGRIVVLEMGYSDARHLLRYLPDGTLDPSFDGDGIALLPADVWAGDIALQADGKILVSGSAPSSSFTLARFLPNGAIDQGFDGDGGIGNGVVHADLTPGSDLPTSITVDGQGRIVLAGHAGYAPGASDAGVARFLPDGRLDKSFAGDGTLAWDTPVELRIWDVAVRGDGKVLVAGGWGSYPTIDTIVQRFTENGTLDTFGPGGSGRVIKDMGGTDQATSIALQPGGQVLVGSFSSGQDTLVRLTSAGEPDPSFEGGGEVPLSFSLSTIALAPDGKIVLGGWAKIDGVDAFAVERRSAAGAPDPAFAGGSPAFTRAVAGQDASSEATVVAPDGKIVSVGATGSYPSSRGVLMRLKGEFDPPAPPVSPPGTTGPTADALTLSGVRLTNRKFAVGRARTPRVGQAQAAARRKRGTAFRFRLNHAATLSIRIKRSGKRVALLKRTAQAGGNRVRFSGRVGRRALRPGRYRATLTAVDAAGKRARPATVAFRILRG